MRLKSNSSPRNCDLKEWAQDLCEDANRYTKQVSLTTTVPEVDARLLHLREARRGLLRRWRRQKLNRKLKIKIAQLTEETLQYATQLAQSNWHHITNKLQGTLVTARTWSLIRHLLDPTMSKNHTSQTFRMIVHNFKGTNEEILQKLINRYIGEAPSTEYPNYDGLPNPKLDRPFTEAEVVRAAQDLTRNTSPSRDKIQNRLLRNLDANSYSTLTQHFNDVWASGKLPAEWKHAEVVLVPKPGKPPNLDNLRPITLTSCLGKLFEHVVLSRLQPYIDDTKVFSHTMFGFRAHLSAQDVFIQLKADILDNISPTTTQAVVVLDVKRAFDNVSHSLILQNLASTNSGQRTYQYVRDFLSHRTATIGVEFIRTDVLEVPGKGTPQGSVLSPTLFNLAMCRLPALLECIPHIKHSLCVDDLTKWTTSGSDGDKQASLQEAIDSVHNRAF
ncbi:hypothetical protein HPB47_023008 [Ixodes persulcatus]|uniref:Uncharacterized protein n=1 Tax=Ixodes persulcatus TaxID=34615 RepID=A0AC60QBB9_IXOPE|nr:hypothetical protein HPB47_023008 [Ixodes persulcatus]